LVGTQAVSLHPVGDELDHGGGLTSAWPREYQQRAAAMLDDPLLIGVRGDA
jgi:hypothetical protein